MASPNEPTGIRRRSPLRLASGMRVLDEWSQEATQAAKNLVNQVLFSIADGRVFGEYTIVDDPEKTMEFFVLTKHEITIKIRVHDLSSFGIIYVGPTISAPGLDRPGPEPGSSLPRSAQDEPDSEHRKHRGTPHHC